MHLFCLPHVLHAPPISFFLIWSHAWYMVRNTEHKDPRCVVSSPPVWSVNVVSKYFKCFTLSKKLRITCIYVEVLSAAVMTQSKDKRGTCGSTGITASYFADDTKFLISFWNSWREYPVSFWNSWREYPVRLLTVSRRVVIHAKGWTEGLYVEVIARHTVKYSAGVLLSQGRD